MKPHSRVWALTVGILLVGSLAGCGGSGSDTSDTDAAAQPSASRSASQPAASPADARPSTVSTASTDLGTILVDGRGMTLYLFTQDTQDSGKSTCEGPCLAAWPPLLGEPQAGTGVDAALLGTLVRSDGSTQVTYNGWPLYFWAQDSAPGDTTGQGVNQVWWVLDAAGDAVGMSG